MEGVGPRQQRVGDEQTAERVAGQDAEGRRTVAGLEEGRELVGDEAEQRVGATGRRVPQRDAVRGERQPNARAVHLGGWRHVACAICIVDTHHDHRRRPADRRQETGQPADVVKVEGAVQKIEHGVPRIRLGKPLRQVDQDLPVLAENLRG